MVESYVRRLGIRDRFGEIRVEGLRLAGSAN